MARLPTLLLAGLIVLGVVTRLRYGYEWDELQLLHGAWSVAHGAVPYRDFFEHHPPLLQILLAPAVGGATATSWRVLIVVRATAAAVLLGVVACYARLVRAGGGPLAAGWAAVGLLVLCPMSGKLFELRADWCGLLALLAGAGLLVTEPGSLARALAAGTLGGVAVCFTQKAAILWAAVVGWRLVRDLGWRPHALALVLGTLLAPALLVLAFATRGAASALWAQAVVLNVGWPREIDWGWCWRQSALAACGPLALALVGARDVRQSAVGSLAAVLAVVGTIAYVLTPVPWEQSFVFLVVPWVACLAVLVVVRWATAPPPAWAVAAVLVVVVALAATTLPRALAVRTTVVWILAGAALAWSVRAGAPARALAALLLPATLLFVRDRISATKLISLPSTWNRMTEKMMPPMK